MLFQLLSMCAVGRDSIRNLQLSYGGIAADVPQPMLRTALTKQFDAYWTNKLFTSVVAENIPYFPLDRNSLRNILQLQLRDIAMKELKNGHMADLVYDSDLLGYLTSNKYIQYLKYSTPDQSSSIVVAAKGGRSITKKGPLSTLLALVVQHMQPWQAGRILHIGVEPVVTPNGEDNDKRLQMLGAPSSLDKKRGPFLYLQWCQVTPKQQSEAEYTYVNARSQAVAAESNARTDAQYSTCGDSVGDDIDAYDEAFLCNTATTEVGMPSEYNGAVIASGTINTRVGLLYSLGELEIYTTNACETKWIGTLQSS